MIKPGSRYLVMGLLDPHSIAFAIGETLRGLGAQVIYTMQNEVLKKRYLDASRALLEACRASGHKPRVVFTSSVAVYGHPAGGAAREDYMHQGQRSALPFFAIRHSADGKRNHRHVENDLPGACGALHP